MRHHGRNAHRNGTRASSSSFRRIGSLLVGGYAQQYYLPREAGKTLVERVRGFDRFAPAIFPTPHPSWRSVGWRKRNPWFDAELLPILRASIRSQLDPT